MMKSTLTREQLELKLKVSRSMLTDYQNSLSKINAQIDAEESEDLDGMRQARSQILYDIQETEADIADYVEQLSAQAT